MADTATKPSRRRLPQQLQRFLELFVLCGFAIAQPLLDVIGRSPETFVFYRVGGVHVVVFAMVIVLVPPVVLWLAVSGVSLLSATAGRVAHVIVAAGLLALIVLLAAKHVSNLRGPLLVIVAAILAVGSLLLFVRSEAVRTFFAYLTPAPLVFALLFLVASPTSDLVHQSATRVSAAHTGAAVEPPVVMIVLDEFPLESLLNSHGQVDGRVVPNFARLAATSHWYRNGTGVSSHTPYAVPAILTGRYPDKKLAPSYVDQPDNLFSLLAADYRIRAFESVTQLCDPRMCDDVEPVANGGGLRGLLGQTWRLAMGMAKPYDDTSPISEQFAEETAGTSSTSSSPGSAKKLGPNWAALKDNQPERFQRFLKGVRPTKVPTLQFLHLLLPHSPSRYLPSGATYPNKLLNHVGIGWGKNEWPIAVDRQRHLLQVAYTDGLLGEVIDRMQQQGIWDDALVVVTADHGQSYIPGTAGRLLSSKPAHEAQIAWVPVFIKEPGQSKQVISDANWMQVDLLPTVADALGLKVPFKVDGISQLSGSRQSSEKHFYNNPGERITFPGLPAFRLVLEGVTDTLVNGSDGQTGLYEMSSQPEWIGKKVTSLASLGVDTAGVPSTMTARLAPEVDLDHVDPSSGTVPALLSGTLNRAADHGSVLIAVNGTVASVSQIWPEHGKKLFAGMVNDALFMEGRNRLALYEVVGTTQPQLRRITIR